MENQFQRTEILIGKQNLEKLKQSKIIIFGLGGVGSYVAEALVRAGIENFILIDNDKIDLTNINRQIHATHKTIGNYKVEEMQKRMLEINPKAQIKTIKEFATENNIEEMLSTKTNYIIDAIDTVKSKIEIIKKAKQKNIPIISCMGTANRIDPCKLEITDIYKTQMCKLARTVRQKLKKQNISKLKVLYSKEEPKQPQKNQDGTITLGSISYVPSAAGLIIASEVVKDIINKP